MVDYPYAGILVADAVTFRRATNAAVTVYDVNDTASANPLVLKDLSGLPLPNPLTSTSDGFVRAFVTTSEGVKLVGGGLTVVEYSHVGIKDAAVAAADAAQGAADSAATAAGNALSTATVDGSGQLVVTKANGATVNAGNVKGPKGDKGDTGAPGSNVLPTDDAIEAAILGTGTKTKAALSATFVPKWKPNTAYLAGDKVLNPGGDLVSAKANFTSGSSYSAANWDLPTTFAQPGADAGIPGYGLVPQNLGKWKAAVANVRAGLGHAHILCAGTSKTWGFPSSFGAGKSWPSQLEKMLNAYHVPAAEGWVSCSSKSSSDNVLDPRITKGAGWASGGPGTGPGQGGGMQWVSGTGAMSFTPGYQFDTISLFYVTFGNKGTVTINVNGGASLGSVNANAAAGLGVSTVTTTLGTGTINVTAPTGGDFQLLAFRAYDSTRKSVLVSNFGIDASKSGDWAENSAAFSSLNTWDKLTPDLSIILHSTNDAGNTVSAATYTANMTTLIDKAATYGSVIVGTETPDNDSEPNYTNYEALYQPALKALAETKGVPYLNLTKRYASETAGRALGFIHTDRVHLTPKGSADVASAVYKALTI